MNFYPISNELLIEFGWIAVVFGQDRARQLLSTDELASCLSQLSTALQRTNDTAARKNPGVKAPSSDPRELFSGSEESQDSECVTTRDNGYVPEVVGEQQPPALSNSEHAYSSFSKGKLLGVSFENELKRKLEN